MPPPLGNIDRRRELLLAWEQSCRARSLPGASDHCNGADAMFLVSAVVSAVRQGGATPELGRAARTWGARFATPVDALAALAALRDVFSTGTIGDHPGEVLLLNQIFDQASMDAVEAASGNLRSAARKDPLTSCANRRALEEDLAQAVTAARRSGLDLAVAVVDLDGLKAINDTEGHSAGDAALVGLVSTMRDALREADGLYRTGGDEFVVLTPFTDAAGARALMRRAERLGGPSFSWGVSSLAELGIAVDDDGSTEGAALLEAADADLYERRRAQRRSASAAVRRRRVTRVASVAASVAVTTSVAGLAVALQRGSVAANATRASLDISAGGEGAPQWPALAAPAAHAITAADLVEGPPPPSALSVVHPASPAGTPPLFATWLDLLVPSVLGQLNAPAVPAITVSAPIVPVTVPATTVPVVLVGATAPAAGLLSTATSTTTTSAGPGSSPPAPTTTTTKPAKTGKSGSTTTTTEPATTTTTTKPHPTTTTTTQPKGGRTGGASNSGSIQLATPTPSTTSGGSGDDDSSHHHG